jgi:hypothetical protein
MDKARADLGDSLRRIPPKNARPVGQIDDAPKELKDSRN